MRIIDDETIMVPNRESELKKVPKEYERMPGKLTIFRLKTHPDLFVVKTWYGLGDTIYQRPFIKELYDIYKDKLVIKTPWPELFHDLNVQFMHPEPKLRMQISNINNNKGNFIKLRNRTNIKMFYDVEDLKEMTMIEAYEKNHFKLRQFQFDLPIKESWLDKAKELKLPENTVLIYAPTLRSEWNCPERNPDPKYFQHLIDNNKDFYYAAIGAIKEGEERYVQELTGINRHLDRGQLHFTIVLALLKMYPSIIRPAFTLPAAIAVGARSICLYGGHLPKTALTDKRMDLTTNFQIQPEPFTFTFHNRPNINRELSLEQIDMAFKEITSG